MAIMIPEKPREFDPASREDLMFRVLEKLPELRPVSPDGGVARLYRLPGAQGNIGLISPLSAHFCAACSRIRLTADGIIKPCLHSGEEYSLKGLAYEDMVEELRRAILCKPLWREEWRRDTHTL